MTRAEAPRLPSPPAPPAPPPPRTADTPSGTNGGCRKSVHGQWWVGCRLVQTPRRLHTSGEPQLQDLPVIPRSLHGRDIVARSLRSTIAEERDTHGDSPGNEQYWQRGGREQRDHAAGDRTRGQGPDPHP